MLLGGRVLVSLGSEGMVYVGSVCWVVIMKVVLLEIMIVVGMLVWCIMMVGYDLFIVCIVINVFCMMLLCSSGWMFIYSSLLLNIYGFWVGLVVFSVVVISGLCWIDVLFFSRMLLSVVGMFCVLSIMVML